MKIYLINDHTAYIRGEKCPNVSITPNDDLNEELTLEIAGKAYTLREGEPAPPVLNVNGYVPAVIYDRHRIKYTVKDPCVVSGKIFSDVDFTKEFYAMLERLDRAERSLADIRGELRQLAANIEPNALKVLNIGKDRKESKK